MNFKSAILVTLSLAAVASTRVYGIGARVDGDQLLINDTLYERTKSILPTNHTIKFQYPVNKLLVSYIEVFSNSNVHAQFELTHDNIVYGTITATEIPEFEVKIRIYGVDEGDVPRNFHPLLTPERELQKIEELYNYEEFEDYGSENTENNAILLGERQPGDELVYESYQHSHASENPENHSVVFYYIDSHYLTYAEFVTIHTSSASATFSQVSDHSIKAVIYDEDVHSLDVKLTLYGFQSNKKPVDYMPMLSIVSQNDPQVFKPECSPLSLIQLHNSSEKFISNLAFIVLSFMVISYLFA